MADDTPLVESDAVLAAVREDWGEACRCLRTMSVHELRAFGATLDRLREYVLQEKERAIIAMTAREDRDW